MCGRGGEREREKEREGEKEREREREVREREREVWGGGRRETGKGRHIYKSQILDINLVT